MYASCSTASNFATPQGQAFTQFVQPMQRDGSSLTCRGGRHTRGRRPRTRHTRCSETDPRRSSARSSHSLLRAGTVVATSSVATVTSSETAVGTRGTGGRYASGAGPSWRDNQHAAVLNAGIQLTGIEARDGQRVRGDRRRPVVWDEPVSGRTVDTTMAGNTASPRRDSTRTASPSATPRSAAAAG